MSIWIALRTTLWTIQANTLRSVLTIGAVGIATDELPVVVADGARRPVALVLQLLSGAAVWQVPGDLRPRGGPALDGGPLRPTVERARSGQVDASQLEQGLDATRSAHHARAYSAQHAMTITDDGVQVLGGHGFIREHPVEMWYRNARTLGVLEGTLSL